MHQTTNRFGWAVAGLVVGFVVGAALFVTPRLLPPGTGAFFFPGPPASAVLMFGLFVTLWILVIAGAIKWLFLGRDRYQGNLADLPADFDDWHRRAHAQMEREAGARAGDTRS